MHHQAAGLAARDGDGRKGIRCSGQARFDINRIRERDGRRFARCVIRHGTNLDAVGPRHSIIRKCISDIRLIVLVEILARCFYIFQ